ncbi:non-ribosomal peptide synthetase [Gordonia sp. YY1]|uniref:non-ribosomal peptide synthetase n=1 Tax=Gordonia sp. YY1 TaxID=396712 RepID=UPI0013319041|nr:non-ribosomal peptide synthetase [Gordonia sp. YY1]KAF0970218.1 Tyrocidine synthase 3 [Gordonia sp. YY1]
MTTDDAIRHITDTDLAIQMTAAQRGVFYAQQLEPDVPMTIDAFIEFRGDTARDGGADGDNPLVDVDPEIMQRAATLTEMETEASMLRLVPTEDGEPLMTIDHSRLVVLGRQDFSDETDPRAAALAWIDHRRSQATDLFADPLLETHLLKVGPGHSIWYCRGHHIGYDGYAAMYLMLRVASHYTAIANGTEPPLADTATMADIAELDRVYRSSEKFAADREHWTRHLADLPEITTLTSLSGPASPLSDVRSAVLDDDLVARIRTLGHDFRVRPASIIAAAVAAYVARFTDRDEATLSLPVAARDRDILRTSAGLISNVVPLRIPLDDSATIAELLKTVNCEIKSAVRHQKFRHEDIVSEILGAAGARRGFFGPLVNVMLFFEHIDFGPLHGELNVLSTGPIEDVSVNVYDSFNGGMSLDLEANPDIYSPDEITRHHRRLVDFVSALVTAPVSTPISQLRILTDDERTALAEHTTGEQVDLGQTTLVDLLDQAAAAHADATAVVDADGAQSLTHHEVAARTRSIAAALADRGVGPESVVAVQLARSVDQVLALHGVVRAGAAFLPIDPAEPADRLAHILEIAEPDLIITDAVLDELHAAGEDIAGRPAPDAVPSADQAAYVLFTSGSTGKPKGVVISHRAIVNRLAWMQSRYQLTTEDRVLQKTPSTFDVSVWEFFWPFIAGAGLVVPSADGHRDPWYLRDVIAENGVTTVHFVPSMLAAFTAALDSADASRLTSLRRIFTSGEALTTSTVGATARLTSAPIHNLYGPTEAAIDVTHHDSCRPDAALTPIGSPVWNTGVHVLDHRLRSQPVGAVGELYLSGVQLARGYRSRPDLTAARFVASPDGDGERLYRTGDLARILPDGELEYLGRTDSQVKIRGQRVELGEIESALSRLDGVTSVAATVRNDLAGDEPAIAGYVTGDGLDDRDLRAELRTALPEHMIPVVVMALDALPTTVNGKLDRRALPRPELRNDREFVGPATALDRLVVRTVADVLGADELADDALGPGSDADPSSISMRDRFFDVGGTSLSATRVASRLSRATGKRIGIRTIFDADDIGGIVDALVEMGVDRDEAGRSTPAHPDAEVRTASPVDSAVPLSPAQHRLWLAGRLDPAAAATYNMPFTVRLVGALDTDGLRQALVDVIARHEPLRSVVVEQDGVACMSPRPADRVDIDLPVLDSPDPNLTSDRDFASRTFDLDTELPIRARLVRTSADDHRLTLVVNHIAADGWSLAPLAADLATAYRARLEGSEPDWAALPVTYSQVSAERHTWLSESADATAELDHWRDTLAGAPKETDLPLDRPRTGRGDATGAAVTRTLSPDTHRAIRELAGATGTTVFMVLHAAVAALLRSLSRSSDIVVGTPVSGRGDADLDGVVGMFVNTLALRTSVDKDAGFVDLLAHVRDTDLSAFDNADLPFDRVVTELNPDRSSHVHPFFQVSLALEDRSAIRLDFAGLSATASRVDTGYTTFDLQLTFTELHDTDGEPAGLDLEIGYAIALFDRSTVSALASRLDRVLRAATAAPDSAVGDLPVLDLHERLDLVPAVGEGSRPVEHLTTLLSTAAESSPHRIAITDGNRSLTYRELDEASNRLARLLIDRGAGPERHVAVALPRGVDWMIAMWAVARSGAAWVPVDPAYPAARIAHMLTDSGSCLLLTDESSDPRAALVDESAAVVPRTVVLDDHAVVELIARKPAAPVSPSERPGPLDVDQPAYLIYTSGTTGRPKGVVVSHRGLADFGAQQVTQYGITADSQTMHMASPSFDASVLEILMAVAAGSTMHIIPPGVVGGAELARLMREGRITHAFLTPSVLTTMAPDDVPDLEALVIGGEHPNPEVVRTWSTGPKLFNAYGPTETTVVAAVSAPIEPDYTTLTIGRPIRGVSALVLDERLQPVAPGAIGELYIAGEHLARGYHGVRPLTSKRFIANPFGDPGERMYRTGDLVRWTTDHELEFRGRADHQTKIRGHRIELGEIDAVLVADAAVRGAVTTTHGEGDRAHLVSYVTMGYDTSDAVSDVRERLAYRLPRHMIPSMIVELDEIPTTPIGKIDLRALPAPDTLPNDNGTVFVAPITPIEQTVADLIAERLDLSPGTVGRHHDFFDLGGNSLLATQIVGALEHLTGRRVPVREIFDHSTVADIARLADGGGLARPGADEARVPRLIHDPDAPAEPGAAQQQLWFLNQLALGAVAEENHSATAGYAIAFALDLRGRLDVDALGSAIRRAVERHVMLRTVYPDVDGRPVLDVRPAEEVTLDLEVTDTTAARWPELARALAARPFDLTTDLPLRTALHRFDGDPMHHRLSVVIHHIAADGWSMIPLHRDIILAYGELRSGAATNAEADADEPSTAIDYLDYLRWQAGNLADDDELGRWWRHELDGVDTGPILIPDAPAGRTRRAEVVEVEFSTDVRRRLTAVSAGRATEFMSVHALFAALLHRLHADPGTHVAGAASDIVIGTPVAGRNDPRLADVVGMFVNSVVLRTPVDGRASFTELLDSVRHRDLEALSQSDMPFERIVSMVNPPRNGRHPIFQIALVFDAQTSDASASGTSASGTSGLLDPADLEDLRIEAEAIDTGAARFDLELRIRDGRALFTYATDVHSRDRVESLARMFADLAETVTAHPEVPVDDLPLATSTIHSRQPADEPTITPRHLADIITATARRHPDQVAVEDGDRRLTYGEIDEISTVWAHNLRALEVGSDDVVAVALDRSLESVIATWAVAKSGAAILPVDTRYPADRIAHMIADSGASLGITTADRFADVPQDVRWVTPGTLGTPGESRAPEERTSPRHTDSLAYIVYTSGSTGKPKGVSVTHRGLAAFATTQRDRYRVSAGDRTLHFASPSFDAAMLEFLLAFEVGATMVIVPPAIYGGDELVDFLDLHAVTHAFITPAALATAAPHPLPHLRTLGVGGEASTPDLVARWGSDRRYVNSYGPTETTIVAVMSSPLRPGMPITIGTPVTDCTALVLDHRLLPVPDHVPGELYLSGPGVARGYLDRRGPTAARFVARPDGSGEVMYRTGDIVRRDADGALIYHGRSDNQVKVRGFRIELDEVTAALTAAGGVDFATTVVRGEGADAVLVGYVTLTGPTDAPDSAAILDAARQRLPRHMVPSAVVVLDSIPLTRNGKLDHRALPDPATTAQPSTGRAPRTVAESALTRILADVLDLRPDDVGATDDFFLLGGTSLQATTLVSRINRVHVGERLLVRNVFDHPTPESLAPLLTLPAGWDVTALDENEADSAEAASEHPGAEHISDRPAQFPLAPIQRRLHSMATANPESTDYLMPFVLRLRGELDVPALRGALVDIVARHTSLRTVFEPGANGPVGRVLDDPDVVIGDLRVQRTDDVHAEIARCATRPVDVSRQAPITATLVVDRPAPGPETEHLLVLVLHHIAADGASLPILVADLARAYDERRRGRTGNWAPAAVDYRDHALESDDVARLAADLRYWEETLADAPAETTVASPAIDRPPSAAGARSVSLALPAHTRAGLLSFAREQSTTPFSVLHTALAILLHRLGIGHDLVVGSPVANRDGSAAGRDYSGVVGMFVNVVPLRTRLDAADTVAGLVRRVRDADIDALDHRGLPFDDIVSSLNPPRTPGRHPLFQVALSVHDFAAGTTSQPTGGLPETTFEMAPGLHASITEFESPAAKFDLQFTVTGMRDGDAALQVTYDTARYRHQDAELLATRLMRVVRGMLGDPGRSVGDIRVTDPLEIVERTPALGPPAQMPTTLDRLFAQAVQRNPDGVAAMAGSPEAPETITYAELDSRSNRLARVLLGRGVGAPDAEHVVAMAVQRSIESLVAIWAIVKTGAAYVPIDPTYPADRIAHMLGDSGARLVVTTSAARESISAGMAGDPMPMLVLDDAATATRMQHSSPAPVTDAERGSTIRPDQLAYIIYTSGSTGRPKGVLVPHSGLRPVHDELAHRLAPAPESRVSHFASPSFDASVLEMLLALAGSATLVIVGSQVYGGDALSSVIDSAQVTHAFITPAAVASMSPSAVPSLRALAVGGEDYGADLVRRWAPGRTLINVYGPTETTIIITGSESLTPERQLTIGTPNNGVGALVLDERLHPVPAGVVGELYLMGPQITRGYHRRPGLTSTRFLPVPMVSGPRFAGRRMYRTGDLVRWTEDGRLVYAGRGDTQVQVRGFRIELGEIDDALTTEPDVDFAATLVDGAGATATLRSYVTAADGATPEPADLRRRVSRRLPRHMVPTSVTLLDAIPLTPTGKLDRKALPAPAEDASRRAPSPGGETTIAQVFAEVLEVRPDTIGADDGFFDLGGNSLLATTVTSRLTELIGRQVSAQSLFGAPSPAELAAALGMDGENPDPSEPAGTPGLDILLPLRRSRSTTAESPDAPPLFVVHPAIGLSWSFTSLLPHLASGRALYGLQHPALSGKPCPRSIGDLAAEYVAQIRTVYPEGPYHLLGWSLGGLIAHEMAVQLREAGDEVARLVLLDSYVISERPDLDVGVSITALMREFGLDVDTELPSGTAELTVDDAYRIISSIGGALAGLSRETLGTVHEVFRHASPLAEGWRPRLYDGDLTFVTATVDPEPGAPAVEAWHSKVTGRVVDVGVRSTHARMMLPEHVSDWVHAISEPPATPATAPREEKR